MFNPIHFGHLLGAQEVAENINLQEILFIPTGIPPHRSSPEIPAEFRLQMTRLATDDNSLFKVYEGEIKQESVAYTIETLENLSEQYPNSKLCLIIGTDELAAFKRWHRWKDIIEIAQLVVMNRPGNQISEIPGEIREHFQLVDISSLDISSTQIRNKRKNNCSIRYLVPEPVREFIQKHELYLEN